MIPHEQIRLRLACAWPLLIGARTLRRLRHENILDAARTVKVPRRKSLRTDAALGAALSLAVRLEQAIWRGDFGKQKELISRVIFIRQVMDMINRKLCIVVCCLGVGFTAVAEPSPHPATLTTKPKRLRRCIRPKKGQYALRCSLPLAFQRPGCGPQFRRGRAGIGGIASGRRQMSIAGESRDPPSRCSTLPRARSCSHDGPPANSEEDARALEALHQAEKAQPGQCPAAPIAAPAPAPSPVAAAQFRRGRTDVEALRQAEKTPARPAPAIPVAGRCRRSCTAPAPVAAAPLSEGIARTLEAFRRGEGPVASDSCNSVAPRSMAATARDSQCRGGRSGVGSIASRRIRPNIPQADHSDRR